MAHRDIVTNVTVESLTTTAARAQSLECCIIGRVLPTLIQYVYPQVTKTILFRLLNNGIGLLNHIDNTTYNVIKCKEHKTHVDTWNECQQRYEIIATPHTEHLSFERSVDRSMQKRYSRVTLPIGLYFLCLSEVTWLQRMPM